MLRSARDADDRVGADHKQRPDLAGAGGQDFLRQRRGKFFAAHRAGAADTAGGQSFVGPRAGHHFGMERIVRPDHVGQRAVPGALHTSADEGQAVDEVLGGIAEWRHAGAGSAIGAALAGIAREHLCDREQLARGQPGAARNQGFAKRFDCRAQVRHSLRADVAGAEVLVFPAIGQHQADDPGHYRDILPRQRLQQ